MLLLVGALCRSVSICNNKHKCACHHEWEWNQYQKYHRDSIDNKEFVTKWRCKPCTITSWNCFTSQNVKTRVATNIFEKKLRTLLQLNNQSTKNIFCRKDYLVNIHKTNKTLERKTNGGDLERFITVISLGLELFGMIQMVWQTLCHKP